MMNRKHYILSILFICALFNLYGDIQCTDDLKYLQFQLKEIIENNKEHDVLVRQFNKEALKHLEEAIEKQKEQNESAKQVCEDASIYYSPHDPYYIELVSRHESGETELQYLRNEQDFFNSYFSKLKKLEKENKALFDEFIQNFNSDNVAELYQYKNQVFGGLAVFYFSKLKQEFTKAFDFCRNYKKSLFAGSIVAIYSSMWAKIKFIKYKLSDPENWSLLYKNDDKMSYADRETKAVILQRKISQRYDAKLREREDADKDLIPYLMLFMQDLTTEEQYLKQYLSLYNMLSKFGLTLLFPGQFNKKYIDQMQNRITVINQLKYIF